MHTRLPPLARFTFVLAAALLWPATSIAQVNVMISGGFRAAYLEVLPEFERTTGIKVTTTAGASQGNSPNAIGVQLRRGVPADVVIMSKEGLADLIAEGRIVAASDIDLAQSPLGVGVPAGTSKPDISTIDAFKRTLLAARSIALNSTTGIYLVTKMFPQLGIAEALASKTTNVGVTALVSGDAEIALQPVSELLHAAGVAYVGPIPTDIQYISVFTAAVVAGSKELDASKRLIAFLASEKTTAAIRNNGMERSRVH
jgi:molybdate transport system substrate-binding protein